MNDHNSSSSQSEVFVNVLLCFTAQKPDKDAFLCYAAKPQEVMHDEKTCIGTQSAIQFQLPQRWFFSAVYTKTGDSQSQTASKK